MMNAWGFSWGTSWGASWGAAAVEVTPATGGGGGFVRRTGLSRVPMYLGKAGSGKRKDETDHAAALRAQMVREDEELLELLPALLLVINRRN